MRLFRFITLTLLSTHLATSAQEPERPEQLEKLREIYLQQRDSLRAEGLRSLVDKLTALESSFTESGDSEAAAEVKAALAERRRQLAALSASAGDAQGHPKDPSGTITLYPRQAHIAGSLKRSRSTLYSWTSTTCNATWSTREFPPGRYDVYLDYYPVRRGGGKLEVRDLHQAAVVTIPPYRDGGENRSTIKAATFDLRRSISLRLTPKTRNRSGLFSLQGIRLVRVKQGGDSR